MSSRRGHLRLRYGAGAVALALCATLAASALGFVDIYENPFSKNGQYRQISKVDKSQRCKRNFLKARGVMEIKVQSAPKLCAFEPPVQGDASRPDHRFDVAGRIRKTTDSNIRDDAYLSISVRVGGGRRYELRVFPKDKEFKLRRQPSDAGFPVGGTDPAIGAIGELNRLRLTVEGDNVKAHVNGAKVADLDDANSSGISGRKLEFGIGSSANSRRTTEGNFDRLKLSVPDPP